MSYRKIRLSMKIESSYLGEDHHEEKWTEGELEKS